MWVINVQTSIQADSRADGYEVLRHLHAFELPIGLLQPQY